MSKLSDLLLKELESFNTEISKEELKKKIQINKAINETAKNLNETISLEIEFEKLKANSSAIVNIPEILK